MFLVDSCKRIIWHPERLRLTDGEMLVYINLGIVKRILKRIFCMLGKNSVFPSYLYEKKSVLTTEERIDLGMRQVRRWRNLEAIMMTWNQQVAVPVLRQVVFRYIYGMSLKQVPLMGASDGTKWVSVHTWHGRVRQILPRMKPPEGNSGVSLHVFTFLLDFYDRGSESLSERSYADQNSLGMWKKCVCKNSRMGKAVVLHPIT